MTTIKRLITLLATLFPLFAHAVGEPYTQEKMDALSKAGKPTLVFVYADWCPTCKAQEKILNELLPTAEFKGLTTLKVNFDEQKTVLRAFGVKYQSTFILFKGGKEVVRVTAETDRERIAEWLRQVL
ncbi:MAG: thioredoxin family protein [Gallionella sp.]|nr:thioredoxin family protein [Gallionella sp.]